MGSGLAFKAVSLGVVVLALLSASCSAGALGGAGESVYGKYLVGRHAETRGDITVAIDELAEVLQQEKADDPALQRHLFFLNLSSGDFTGAKKLASSFPQPESDPVVMFLGLSRLKSGEYDLALESFASLSDTPAREWISSIASAWILWEAGRRDEAEALLATLDEEQSLAGFRYFHEALMADLRGDAARAQERYLLAIEKVDGAVLRFLQGYGNFLERKGRMEEARQFYDEYLLPNNFGPGLWELRRQAMERNETPTPLVRDGLEGNAELFYGVFTLLAFEPDSDAALPYLRFALFLRPDFNEARLLLGEQYEKFGFADAAMESYRAIPKQSPYYVNAQVQVAQLLVNMEKHDEAIALLVRLRDAFPESRVAAVALASLYRIREHYDEAIAVYSSIIDSIETPLMGDWMVYYGRAVSYERSDRWLEAEADLQTALRLSNEHPLVLNYLGYSWVDQGERLDVALEMLQKATRNRPQNGFIVDSLGWAYYKLGDFDQATLYLERAVELEPGDPIINDHLGDSFWRSGRKLEARFQWRRALLLEPEEEEIAGIEEKLLRGLPLQEKSN